MRLEPLNDVVMIRRLAPSEVSDGGIYLVHDEDYKEDIGIVAFVGTGKRIGCKHCKTEKILGPAVKPGDKVLFSTNGHQITVIDGQEYVVCREPSIIGVFAE